MTENDNFYGICDEADVQPLPCEIIKKPDSSGLKDLTKYSTPDEISVAVKRFVRETDALPTVDRGIAKHELLKKLKTIKFQGAGDFVKGLFKENQSAKKPSSVDTIFADPEPWADEVDGGELLDKISQTLKKFIMLPTGAVETIALWILHAWVLGAFYLSPILRITSPTKGCGKSTLLILVGHLMPRNFMSGNLTTATLFRLIDEYEISVCIDEADQSFKQNEELVSLVNSGYLKKTAMLPRCEGPENTVKIFSSWGAKVIAGIGSLPDTTESRCLTIRLEKKTAGETVARLLFNKLGDLDHIREKCERWAGDNIELLKGCDPEIPKSLGDRPSDNWRGLLGISDLCGGDWPEKARNAALIISGSGCQNDDSFNVQLLCDVWEIFKETDEERLSSLKILSELRSIDEKPWGDWCGKPITASRVAKLLKPFGITPVQFRDSGAKERGYLKKDFISPVTRYQPGTPGTGLKNKDLEAFQPGTESENVPTSSAYKTFKNNDVPAVPASNPLPRKKNKKNAEIGFEVRL